MEKVILIDASGLIYRGFYAIPPFLKSPGGVLTNAVFGFTTILLGLIASQKPDYIAVAYDKKGPTFRHKEFTEYKATRVKAPQELYDQIPLVKKMVETFKIPSFEAQGFEADDVLATIANHLKNNKNVEVLIATGDFDMFQMVSPNVAILYPEKGFKETRIFKRDDVVAKYSLTPEQIPDYKGIAGDSSDNLPGVKGIGEKGAKDLLQKYGTLEAVFAHSSELSQSLQKKLSESKDQALMCKRLATLDIAAPLQFDLETCKVQNFNISAVSALFRELGFRTLEKKVAELYAPPQKQQIQGQLF